MYVDKCRSSLSVYLLYLAACLLSISDSFTPLYMYKYINYCLFFMNICILIDLYFALFYDYYDKKEMFVSFCLFVQSIKQCTIECYLQNNEQFWYLSEYLYIYLKLKILFVQTITNKMDNYPYLG